MGWLRMSTRLGAFVLFLAATTALAASLLLAETVTGKVVDRTPWSRFCFRWACRCLGLRIRQHGAPCQDNALLVCNHISWSDIPVLGSLQPIRFLSKAEVSRWPLIGWLARQAGTLFIVRGGGQARKVRRQIADTLSAGETVLVFPEGTTSAGLTVSQGLASVHRGELDERDTDTIRTAAGPAQSRHPSLPGGRQSPDRSTG